MERKVFVRGHPLNAADAFRGRERVINDFQQFLKAFSWPSKESPKKAERSYLDCPRIAGGRRHRPYHENGISLLFDGDAKEPAPIVWLDVRRFANAGMIAKRFKQKLGAVLSKFRHRLDVTLLTRPGCVKQQTAKDDAILNIRLGHLMYLP